jgi:hypothetical protein
LTKRIQQEDFKLKDDKILEPPDVYLGATLAKMMTLPSGKTSWTTLPEQYVKATAVTNVTNVKEDLADQNRRLPPKCVTPFSSGYAPWLEVSLQS